ncbi:ATP-binding cassette domain-containing protein [Bosea beijingensis]|uniref:ATP-binding cassette domain-containing protein n=1 Tax=Bosea beijingensis TaxID=3068632 RepID=UPI002741EE66|nr:ATP-binding cassette domain-containing protein [Bosea sp. REN20]
MSGLALRVVNATRTYHIRNGFRTSHALHALRGVDLEVQRGGTLGIVGESGSGKSTLAKLVLGIEKPSSGAVSVGGRPIVSYSRLERARLIQAVFQDPYSSLNPMMPIERIIAAPLSIQGTDRSTIAGKVAMIAGQVGLSAHHLRAYPSQLSGGQRQRVAIARALIGSPESRTSTKR